ncbi:FkbM family methyltransferase [Gemmatimonas sp. UBA7669]|uniref:FkbM family methyltransferase n=1 Tax=Gemmatimonas sp. UBA7669 TaxID=1946568 RepID=UPI0025BBA92F|nr:FkbM family methyltransferase [Gemmatimonas sp. UBA7669]
MNDLPTGVTRPSIALFRPTPTSDLTRIGRAGDGGYVIPSRVLAQTDVLIGLGIENDWSFEDTVRRTARPRLTLGVDGTTGSRVYLYRAFRSLIGAVKALIRLKRSEVISSIRSTALNIRRLKSFSLFWYASDARFIEKMIRGKSVVRSPLADEVTWAEIEAHCRPSDRIVLKIDIEGSEYEVLPDVLSSWAKVICITAEFHDLGERWTDFCRIIENLSDRFIVVHAHANNFAGVVPETNVPEVVEITFLSRSLLCENEHLEPTCVRYPIATLDVTNNKDRPDLALRFDLLD